MDDVLKLYLRMDTDKVGFVLFQQSEIKQNKRSHSYILQALILSLSATRHIEATLMHCTRDYLPDLKVLAAKALDKQI